MRLRVIACGGVCAAALAAGPAVRGAPAIAPYQAVTVESPSPEAHSVFGEIVHTCGDIDHDGDHEVITTAGTTVNGVSGVGRVWILDGRTRDVLLTIDDPEPQPNAGFGASITCLGDVNGDGVPDIAVGAAFQSVYSGSGPGCDQPAPNGCNANQGKMYVFSGRDGHVLYSVDDPRPQANAYFGALFVTATNDLNGDGVPDFAVTAPGETVDGLANGGAAYVFEGKDGHLIRRLTSPTPSSFKATNEAFFSMGLTNPGDIDGDHVDDLIVGWAGTTVDGNVDQGRAYLFSGRTGQLLRTFDDPVPQPFAYFGSMYGDPYAPGDVNGDGVRDVYIDADGQTVAGLPSAGQAYLFSGRDGRLLRTLTSPMPQDHGFFGFISSPAGDLFGDGREQLLVGQTGAAHVTGSYAFGGAWVFDPSDGHVLADFTALAPDGGQGIAAPGDVNGDGVPDYFVGAPRTDVGSTARQGRVFQLLSVPGAAATLAARVRRQVRRRATAFTATGRLVLPAGVSPDACGGLVSIAITRGSATVARGTAELGAGCGYRQRLVVPRARLRGRGRNRAVIRFGGNFLVRPATVVISTIG